MSKHKANSSTEWGSIHEEILPIGMEKITSFLNGLTEGKLHFGSQGDGVQIALSDKQFERLIAWLEEERRSSAKGDTKGGNGHASGFAKFTKGFNGVRNTAVRVRGNVEMAIGVATAVMTIASAIHGSVKNVNEIRAKLEESNQGAS